MSIFNIKRSDLRSIYIKLKTFVIFLNEYNFLPHKQRNGSVKVILKLYISKTVWTKR